ncbi:MAG TPA: hypothetical protein VIC58_07210, partial [Actinomycetota bacterium]
MGSVPRRSIVRGGLMGAVVCVFISLVGLYTRFADLELVGEQVTFSRLLVLAPALVAAFVVVRPRVVAGERVTSKLGAGVVGGLLTGLVTGAGFAAAVWFADWFGVERIREVFINVTEPLVLFLTFDKGVPEGLPMLVGVCAIGGIIGGFAQTAPAAIRTPVSVGVLAVLVLGLLQRIVPIIIFELGWEVDWLYSPVTRGLTWLGGALIFVVAAGLTVLWQRSGERTKTRARTIAREQPAVRVVAVLAFAAILIVLPHLLGTVISEVLGQVMVFVLLGFGLNIVVGYAGLLDLGYVAFFAFGAYTTALLTGAFLNTSEGAAAPALSADLNFYVAVWIVAALAALLGLLIGAPVLRLRGDYLAIVTLGLGEIVSIITASRWAAPL